MREITEQMVRAYDDGSIECWGQPDHGRRIVDCCRRAGLAAAYPLIAADVRKATADEIAAKIVREVNSRTDPFDPDKRGLLRAYEIAVGAGEGQ